MTEALADTFDCFDASGVGHIDQGVAILQSGLPFPNYGWGGGTSDVDVDRLTALGDACLKKNSYFVELLYQTQPSAVEGEDHAFETRRASVVECLNRKGVQVASDATRSEIEDAASAAIQSLDSGASSASPQADAIIACLAHPA